MTDRQAPRPEPRAASPQPRAARVVLFGAIAVHAVAALISFVLSPQPAGDFDRYYQIASGRGRPYIDYQVEHPIGTLLVFKTIAQVPGGRASFGGGIVALDTIADAMTLAALAWGWGIAAAACYAVTVLPVIDLYFNRIDAWSTAAAVLAAASWKRGRTTIPGAALAIGSAFKLWPALLSPMFVIPWRGRRSMAATGALVTTAAALGAIALAIAGGGSLREVLTFRGATGWQIESTVGSILNLMRAGTPRMESGAFRIGATYGPISIVLFLAAAPVCLWSIWRGISLGRLGLGWLAAVSSLLLLSPLFSAQYVIWLTPAAAIAFGEDDRVAVVPVGIATLLTLIFMRSYGAVLNQQTAACLIVVVRNCVVLAGAAYAIAALARRERPRASLEHRATAG